MERVIVIGSPGAGKSTFARRLRDITGLPLHYLDCIWHKPDGTHISRPEFDARLAEILQGDRWIIDGNYQRTLPPRLERCDTVILLDYPMESCLEGAAARIGTRREDLPWVERSFDPEFRQFILDFPQAQLPEIRALLAQWAPRRQIVVLRTRQQGEEWLCRLAETENDP